VPACCHFITSKEQKEKLHKPREALGDRMGKPPRSEKKERLKEKGRRMELETRNNQIRELNLELVWIL